MTSEGTIFLRDSEYLTIRPVALTGYGSIAHEGKQFILTIHMPQHLSPDVTVAYDKI